jgi:hypothetical protein
MLIMVYLIINSALLAIYLFSSEEQFDIRVWECSQRILDYLINNCAFIPIYILMRRTLKMYRLRMSRVKLKHFHEAYLCWTWFW